MHQVGSGHPVCLSGVGQVQVKLPAPRSLWLYGFMVLWLYGFMVLWFYGFMAFWFYGFKVLLLCDFWRRNDSRPPGRRRKAKVQGLRMERVSRPALSWLTWALRVKDLLPRSPFAALSCQGCICEVSFLNFRALGLRLRLACYVRLRLAGCREFVGGV